MSFFTTAVTGLKTVVTAIGAGVAVWGVINLLEGYGNDNPGANWRGMYRTSDAPVTLIYRKRCDDDFCAFLKN